VPISPRPAPVQIDTYGKTSQVKTFDFQEKSLDQLDVPVIHSYVD